MPAGDGTGPAGMGPMTGRAAGYCAGYNTPGYVNQAGGRGFGFGRGRGGGRGFGRGRGWGQGWAYPYPAATPYYGAPSGGYPYNPDISPQQESSFLQEQAKALQGEIDSINQRIKDLGKTAKKSK